VPVAPGVNDQEKEEDEAEAQKYYHPGLILPKPPEPAGDFSNVHAEANLHHSGHKQKGSGAVSPALASPVEGPLLHGIQVADKQDHEK
jgi:hypothetical protein